MTTDLAELVDAMPGWHETIGPLPALRDRLGLAFDAGIPPWALQPYRVRDVAGAWTYIATPTSLDADAIADLAALVDHGFDVAIAVDPATPDPTELHLPPALAVTIRTRPAVALELDFADVDAAPVRASGSVPCPDSETYRAHASSHRQAPDGSWSCEACTAAAGETPAP
ncbi:MAG TPA: hypothetical protein VGM28_02905 [Candidatus Limnocylindrales bacterium]|jgi:hypothetical protein